ncbi:GAF domain-containing protein [Rapidithrix thailandica]|uniref:GAF domain-containing protein n=1 Tax=Rapidithrix thailandica TaxID=413964 RepID=A0AAW9S2W5_9BACT
MDQMIQTTFPGDQKTKIFKNIWKKADRITSYTLLGYFVFGLAIAPIYDTWLIALGVGSLGLLAFYATYKLLPDTQYYQYVASALYVVFMAQFIYQMHGLFEMHFWAFVGCTLLIVYQNWKLHIPLAFLIIAHHAGFAYLQYSGVEEVYFTQLQYMDLQTFVFHALLATLIIAICAYWSYDLGRKTLQAGIHQQKLEHQLALVKQNVAFAEKISNGQLDTHYTLNAVDDELGQALLTMRDGLVKAAEKEQQEKFINQGIAQVGDILRSDMHNPEKLYNHIVQFLAKYMELNQVGLFQLEHDHLAMKACYAYERKKYLQKRVEIGEGLLGQAYLEKDMIYMTDVPNGYTHITSGLGHATPGCILIMPLMSNEKVVGVLEMASFKVLNQTAIEFIKKTAEAIATSLLTVKNTEFTQKLLEQAQDQTEQMRAQEEELRQSMEELTATQEEMHRKAEANEIYMELIEKSGWLMAEINPEGEVQQMNEHLAKALSIDTHDLQAYPNFSKDIEGEPKQTYFQRQVTLQCKRGNTVCIEANFRKVLNKDGSVAKIIMLGTQNAAILTAG